MDEEERADLLQAVVEAERTLSETRERIWKVQKALSEVCAELEGKSGK